MYFSYAIISITLKQGEKHKLILKQDIGRAFFVKLKLNFVENPRILPLKALKRASVKNTRLYEIMVKCKQQSSLNKHKMKFAIITLFLSATLFVACENKSQKGESNNEKKHMQHEETSSSGYADSVNNGLIAVDTMKKSVPRVTMQTIGKTHIHINYASPGVKGRIIWGGLVPYNTVWVTGAHSATKINFNNAITINNTKIEAGTYAIFTIPNEKEWIFILNKNYEQHLTDNYSDKEDVLRFAVKPQANTMTQRLTYVVNKQTDNSGSIEIFWEKIKIVVPFKTLLQ